MTGSRPPSFGEKRAIAGVVIIELLVATGVFLVTFSSIISLIMSSRFLVTDAQDGESATRYAEEGLDAVRLLRDSDWNSVPAGTYGLVKNSGNWQLSGTSDSQGKFQRVITISANSANRKTVASAVTWQAQTRTPKVSLLTVLTNWKVTQQDNFISGDWQNPITAGTADVDSGAQGTDVQVEGGKVYLSSAASLQSKPDISVFNVADPNNPIKISSGDLGVSNLSSITKSGNYVYASISGSTYEFMVIDVSDPLAPKAVKSVDFSNGRSTALTVSGTMLYVGLERITGEQEFYAVDVSNPLSPVVRGSFEVDGTVNSISIFNNRAYLATSVDIAELMVLDISNPAAITKLGQYDAPSTDDGTAVFVKDEYNVYLGREQSSSANEFFALNAGNPAAITLQGSANLSARVNDMVIVNRLAFLVTEQPNAEFRVLDIANPAAITTYSTLNFPENATGIAYENNTIYCSVRSNSALRILKSG